MDGFAILGAWLAIGAVAAFYRFTTSHERWLWSRNIIGWMIVGIVLAGVYEAVTALLPLLR